MKTMKTNTVNTAKAAVITEYCNLLLEPAGEYMECTPKAKVNENGDLTFDFTLENSANPSFGTYPAVTFDICNIADVEDGEDLSDYVNEALRMPDDIDEILDYAKKELGFDSQAAESAKSDLEEVLPQICFEFFRLAYVEEEEVVAPGF